MPGASEVIAVTRKAEGVEALSARLLLSGALRSNMSSVVQVVQVVAADPVAEASFNALADKVVEGGFMAPPPGAGRPDAPLRIRSRKGITIGKKLADQLKVRIGSKVRLDTAGFRGTNVALAFYVTGIFSTGTDMFDRRMALVSLKDMQEATGAGDVVHEIAVRVADRSDISVVVDRIGAALSRAGRAGQIAVQPWWVVSPEIRQMVNMMESFNGMMYFMVLVILSAGILTTIYMVVYERKHEFGVQMALGTRPGRLFVMIMVEAAWMAALAAAVGIALGVLVVWYLAVHGIDLSILGEGFDFQGLFIDNVYKGSTAPDVFIEPTVVVVLGTLFFALWPALKVARMKVLDAMRESVRN